MVVSRNLQGFAFPGSINAQERSKVESILVQAMGSQLAGHEGRYAAFEASSQSMGGAPLSAAQQASLRLLSPKIATCPDTHEPSKSEGLNRDWPTNRGAWITEDGPNGGSSLKRPVLVESGPTHSSVTVLINEKDHVTVVCESGGHSLAHLLEIYASTWGDLTSRLHSQRAPTFSRSEQLGHLVAHPEDASHSSMVSIRVRLPNLALTMSETDLGTLCKEKRLELVKVEGEQVEVSLAGSLGHSEASLLVAAQTAVLDLIGSEKDLNATANPNASNDELTPATEA